MSRWRKVVVVTIAVVVAMPIFYVGAIYASAWYHRWRAQQLLAVLKTVRPGMTTQAEYMRLVHPFEAVSEWLLVDNKALPGAISLSNRANWIEDLQNERLARFDNLLSWRVIPPYVGLSVIPSFEGGVVSKLDIEEMTAVAGHPPGAFVHWDAQRFEGSDSRVFDGFSGYSRGQMGVVDQPPWEFFVTMDERATPDERSRALDIQFRCFTKVTGCLEAREYFQPAPKRTGSEDNR